MIICTPPRRLQGCCCCYHTGAVFIILALYNIGRAYIYNIIQRIHHVAAYNIIIMYMRRSLLLLTRNNNNTKLRRWLSFSHGPLSTIAAAATATRCIPCAVATVYLVVVPFAADDVQPPAVVVTTITIVRPFHSSR